MTDSAFMTQVGLFDYDVDTNDDETVTDVVIVAKVSRLDGGPQVIVVHSNGTDVVTVLGLITAAQQITDGEWEQTQ